MLPEPAVKLVEPYLCFVEAERYDSPVSGVVNMEDILNTETLVFSEAVQPRSELVAGGYVRGVLVILSL